MMRALTDDETEVLSAWLNHEVPGVEQLRAHLEQGVKVFSSCDCGCPSIGFEHSLGVDGDSGVGVFPIDAAVLDDSGQTVGGIALFTKGGELHDLDVHSFYEDFPFPPLDRVEFHDQREDPSEWV